ncbi:Mu transposase C-terminal domain-containing protein [Fundidesulfovibrio agrisoli]|uniref:Mu transposase C-terminal domain-containing protein n=1 Tax=Fundidesulfovibrio agrisoli TaxID=2922717 RepID=UPI001FADF6D5|nr:Mu transposase C-terminal domain-containing protein [Fundidesulfovibrio agrisoli]
MPVREAGRVTGNALLHLRPYKLRRTDELWPTDVYTADGTTFDAEIQHPLHGQPWKPEVTLVIDVATRRCVGLAIGEAESAITVLDAIRVACLWGGIPCMFYCDNGSGYKIALISSVASGMFARLDIEMRNSIPGRPQGKGLMERAVQSICVAAAKRLTSCTHADMDGDAGKKVFKITRAELKAFGKSRLLPTFEEFKNTILARVDEYNATPHRALPSIEDAASGKRRHMTPDELWRGFLERGFTPVAVPEYLRGELFMPGTPRKVRNGMVQLFNGTYFSQELDDFHGDYVEVRYDVWDASRVYCWTTSGEKICTAELDGNAMDYFPMPQIEAARERRAKGRIARLLEKVERVAPGATLQLPEHPPTYTILADSITQPTPVASELPQAVVLDMPATAKAEAQQEKRPVFTAMQDRYSWLMQHRDRWTDADHAWVERYVGSDDYADLHPYFESRRIAWPGYAPAVHN